MQNSKCLSGNLKKKYFYQYVFCFISVCYKLLSYNVSLRSNGSSEVWKKLLLNLQLTMRLKVDSRFFFFFLSERSPGTQNWESMCS